MSMLFLRLKNHLAVSIRSAGGFLGIHIIFLFSLIQGSALNNQGILHSYSYAPSKSFSHMSTRPILHTSLPNTHPHSTHTL